MENVTVLNVHTDLSDAVGLARSLREPRITILQFQLLSDGEQAAEVEENAEDRRFQAPGI
jgi:hypothetical protein